MRVKLLNTLKTSEGGKTLQWPKGTIFDDKNGPPVPKSVVAELRARTSNVEQLPEPVETMLTKLPKEKATVKEVKAAEEAFTKLDAKGVANGASELAKLASLETTADIHLDVLDAADEQTAQSEDEKEAEKKVSILGSKNTKVGPKRTPRPARPAKG